MPSSELSNWRVLLLLTWKNCIVFWDHRLSLILTIFFPAAFLIIFVFLRVSIPVEKYGLKNYHPVGLTKHWRDLVNTNAENAEILKNKTNGEFNFNCYVPQNVLAYAPDNDEYFTTIMKDTAKSLDNIPTIGFKDSSSLREAMMKKHYLAGVEFTNTNEVEDDQKERKNIMYTLVFPSEVRFFDDLNIIGSSWLTNNQYDPHNRHMERFPTAYDGGYVGYMREGFLDLQHAIFLSYMTVQSNVLADFKKLPEIKMQRFPIPPYDLDPLVERISCCLSLAILVGFLYPTANFVKFLVNEKKLLLKDAINIFGVSEVVQFFSWFIPVFLMFLIASLLSVVLLMVHWSNGNGIFGKSSWTPIIFFMFIYNLTSICFCYMVSSFFQRPSKATMVHSIAWIFTYFPYIIIVTNVNIFTIVPVYLFSNTAMALGLNQMLDFEEFGEGFGWKKFNDINNHEEANMRLTHIIIIFVGQAIVYTFIGVIMESNKNRNCLLNCKICLCLKLAYYGCRNYLKEIRTPGISPSDEPLVPKPAIEMTSKKNTVLDIMNKQGIKKRTQVVEIENLNKNIMVEIKNLSKIINGVKIIDDVSMDLYEDEITVLLGANGSGKSMLLSMIIDCHAATSGSVIINNIDITKHRTLAHSYVGVSLNENMLFPELTVADQVAFFSRMKGYSGQRLRSNVKKYLRAMNLMSKANVVTHQLTKGVRKQLCACCALCGGSKFVILDQPSTEMDVSTRKLLWDLLTHEKRHRTILIVTQSTEEAEALGDKIGIMSNGKLKCFGSAFFLKSFYSKGMRLTCCKDKHCDVDAVTKLIGNYIPNIQPDCIIGAEFSYKIVGENANILAGILSALETNLESLKLHNFSITELPFEDIFLNMSGGDSDESERTQIARAMNGYSKYVDAYDSLYFFQKNKNFQTFRKRLLAVFLTRWCYSKGLLLFTVLQFSLPMLVAFFSILLSFTTERKPLNKIIFSLNQFSKSRTVIEREDESSKSVRSLSKTYAGETERMGVAHMPQETGSMTMSEFMLQQQKISQSWGSQYMIGATFGKSLVIAWFNNYALHTAPLSLNMAHNALMQMNDPFASITVGFEPLPFSSKVDADKMLSRVGYANMMAFYFGFALCCNSAIDILEITYERVSAFKLLLYINGLRPTSYLMGHLIYDFIKSVIIASLVVGINAIVTSNYTKDIYLKFMVLVLFTFSMSTCFYSVSLFFNSPLRGSITVLLFNVYGAVLYVSLMELHELEFTQTIDIRKSYLWLFQIFPVFSFCSSLNKIMGAKRLSKICMDKDIHLISAVLKQCKANPNCCGDPNVLEWGNTFCIIPEIICIFAFGIICLVFFIILEHNPDLRVLSIGTRNKKKESLAVDIFSQDTHNSGEVKPNIMIEEEKRSVCKLQPDEYLTKSLLMNNVYKSFGHGVAVHKIYLQIEPGECFGLLGINGSGKSTIIKILTGHSMMTSGEIYVHGVRMKTELYSMYKHIGLSPAPSALPENFKVYDIMKIICLLRGIPKKNIKLTCQSLSKVLDFVDDLYKIYGKLSSGNKLRVCAAISMIGSPTIVYFDVITAGIDPVGRRQLWNIIGRMQNMGKSVIFSAVNTRECECICSRVAIIENGTFQYLDTPHNINNNYMKGWLLHVRVKQKLTDKSVLSLVSRVSTESYNNYKPNPFLKVQTYVENTYLKATVKDQRGQVIVFHIPGDDISIADIYKDMHRNAFNLNVAYFSLTCTTLEMLLCDLAEANAAGIGGMESNM